MNDPPSTSTAHNNQITTSITSSASSSYERDANIIGLHVGSRVFYCHRTTLLGGGCGGGANNNNYFERRFGFDRNFNDDVAYWDSNGIAVYFIERGGDDNLFVYVLKYLTNLTLNLPPYNQQNKPLWQDLRQEADFFGLDGMLSLLYATHTCPYYREDEDDDEEAATNSTVMTRRGIIYWLGTGRGTQTNFENPLLVRNNNNNNTHRNTTAGFPEVVVGIQEHDYFFDDRSYLASNLLQFRQPTGINCTINNINYSTPRNRNNELYKFANQCLVSWWRNQQQSSPTPGGAAAPITTRVPLVLHFTTIWIRPTHVSLRVSFDEIMLQQQQQQSTSSSASSSSLALALECSRDGRNWDRFSLRPLLANKNTTTTMMMSRLDMLGAINVALHNGTNEIIRSNLVVDLAEAYLRKTWEVVLLEEVSAATTTTASATHCYYNYFRFTNPMGGYTNLAGAGLEFYGDIHEE